LYFRSLLSYKDLIRSRADNHATTIHKFYTSTIMTSTRRSTAAATLLLLLPIASCLVPQLSIRKIQTVRNAQSRRNTALSIAIDPTDVHHHVGMISNTDFLPSLLTATAGIKQQIIPNQSLAPMAETIQSGLVDGKFVETIPDLIAMPGGVPRSGNPFLAESFRNLYDATLKTNPQTNWNAASSGEAVIVPARELDVVGRYADLLNRIPLAAAVYALVDFFLINAEEDLAIAELLDEDECDAIMEVENKALTQRFVGLFAVVAVTVAWSYMSYHPVPFSEL